ncbi:hypothetical protein GRI89_17660 [Altererythrobacter salegens]|uniref:Sulfotransferase family protein n=1 Tax=Croceibacterium salegens TaxID=1737568 RepID=A0A6I4T3M0_9SPHN|nr:sulfotransferase family protein [Croceibacterium salegens]MXO61372.1 hypothetical protein [Croceibacterium salegens]
MALQVIGAGLGRTGTLSLKLALEHIGFDKCYHMSEMIGQMRAHLPLWVESAKGNPQWDTIFEGYLSSTDYPGCMFWRELAAQYPEAKIILTTRDPERWFESVTETVMSPQHRARFESNPMMAEFFRLTVFDDELEERLGKREPMVEYFNKWNQAVIDEVPAERLLVYKAGDGWEPLCDFLGVSVPPEPYPRVNSREEMTERTGQIDQTKGPPPPEFMEQMVQEYLAELKAKAFPASA